MAMSTWDQADKVVELNIDLAPSNTYSYPGLQHNTFQDLDDTTQLLERINNYEHPPSGNDGPASATDGFESLIQAATQAGAVQAGQHHRNGGDQLDSSHYFGLPSFSQGTKRKRGQKSNGYSASPRHNLTGEHNASEDVDQLAKEREIWGSEEEVENLEQEEEEFVMGYEKTPTLMANARSIGVHSAAALFRRPSSASKKYTSKSPSKVMSPGIDRFRTTNVQSLHIPRAVT